MILEVAPTQIGFNRKGDPSQFNLKILKNSSEFSLLKLSNRSKEYLLVEYDLFSAAELENRGNADFFTVDESHISLEEPSKDCIIHANSLIGLSPSTLRIDPGSSGFLTVKSDKLPLGIHNFILRIRGYEGMWIGGRDDRKSVSYIPSLPDDDVKYLDRVIGTQKDLQAQELNQQPNFKEADNIEKQLVKKADHHVACLSISLRINCAPPVLTLPEKQRFRFMINSSIKDVLPKHKRSILDSVNKDKQLTPTHAKDTTQSKRASSKNPALLLTPRGVHECNRLIKSVTVTNKTHARIKFEGYIEDENIKDFFSVQISSNDLLPDQSTRVFVYADPIAVMKFAEKQRSDRNNKSIFMKGFYKPVTEISTSLVLKIVTGGSVGKNSPREDSSEAKNEDTTNETLQYVPIEVTVNHPHLSLSLISNPPYAGDSCVMSQSLSDNTLSFGFGQFPCEIVRNLILANPTPATAIFRISHIPLNPKKTPESPKTLRLSRTITRQATRISFDEKDFSLNRQGIKRSFNTFKKPGNACKDNLQTFEDRELIGSIDSGFDAFKFSITEGVLRGPSRPTYSHESGVAYSRIYQPPFEPHADSQDFDELKIDVKFCPNHVGYFKSKFLIEYPGGKSVEFFVDACASNEEVDHPRVQPGILRALSASSSSTQSSSS